MNNLLSYCELIDAKVRASDKDLPVHMVPYWYPALESNEGTGIRSMFRVLGIYNFASALGCLFFLKRI